MFAFNKTTAWLDAKTEEERHRILQQATKDAKSIKLRYKERREEIQRCRRESLEADRLEAERKQKDRASEITKICVEIERQGGLWECDDDIKRGLEQLGTDRKTIVIAAIKTQIAYRRKVLLQKLSNTKLWNFSEGGVMFSPAQMIDKLKVIIREPLVQA